MYKFGILCLGLIWAGCNSSHKLTGTDYVDIETESAPEVISGYPSAVIEDAGWNDITTKLKERSDNEEFRIWLNSPIYPANLFKLTKGKKEVKGEAILYWKRDTAEVVSDFTHPTMQQYLWGTCTEFFTVENYGYCFPEFEDEVDWEFIYNTIENQGFWQLPGGVDGSQTEKEWQMYVQMRLGNYYRHYVHQSPEGYEDAELRNRVQRLSGAVKRISNRYKQNISTNLFEGITDGGAFTLCDSSEVWEFDGNLNRMLERAGLKTTVNTIEEESLYYITVKGRVSTVWYNEWATGEFDRVLVPNEIYNIRVVNKFKCPQNITGY